MNAKHRLVISRREFIGGSLAAAATVGLRASPSPPLRTPAERPGVPIDIGGRRELFVDGSVR